MITDSKELGKALKAKQDTIEISGDLKNKVMRIRATGSVAWAVAIGSIGVAVTAGVITVGSGGSAAPATAPVALMSIPVAATTLGASTATTAVTIAIAAGGVGALNNLRKYKIVFNNGRTLVLKRK